ncbi:MAG: extracellular solute-binding protein [Prevotellaceae bacterium]|jgi:spermidine/putrescine transport system substrate-binding protein|nr:extracellular solute-binding protein [Prevotellaceae bacterium]
MLNKILSILAPICAAMALSVSTGCQPHELVIRAFDNGIDLSLLPEFEAYYQQQTGHEIKVSYIVSLEHEALDAVRHGEPCDIANPVQAAIPTYIAEGLVQPIDHSRIVPLDSYLPWLVDLECDPKNRYSVPYGYFTTGLLFNADLVDREDMKSIAVLWNKKYAGKIFVKNFEYELYNMTALYLQRDRLMKLANNGEYPQAFRDSMPLIWNEHSPAMQQAVKEALIEQSKLLKSYDIAKQIKECMVNGTAAIARAWTSEALYAMSHNKSLEFVIPQEGSVTLLPYWVIPKHAQNVEAAYLFLKFMAQPNIALRNMIMSGQTSAQTSVIEAFRRQKENDADFFADKSPEWKAMYFDAVSLSDETLKRVPIYIAPDLDSACRNDIVRTVHEVFEVVKKMKNEE